MIPALPSIPSGNRLYAIGDIHGRADLLQALLVLIEADARPHATVAKRLIYLGDYVDRGPDSKAVIDLVLDAAPPGFEVVTLMGNHEEMMHRFLDDLSVARTWMMNGGDATLESYSVGAPSMFSGSGAFRRAQEEFGVRLPARHREFLDRLQVSHAAGDYLFVHAGVRPGVPLDRQTTDDLLWIRDEFLYSEADFGKIVVHGHSISLDAEFRPNRIGIDTGAYKSGQLSCLVLQDSSRYLLST